MDPDAISKLTYLWIVIFSLLGWACASLSTLAGWGKGTSEEKLKIIQGMFASVGAGLCAYFMTKLILNASEMLAYVLVMAAGFGGERSLRRYFQKAHDRADDD